MENFRFRLNRFDQDRQSHLHRIVGYYNVTMLNIMSLGRGPHGNHLVAARPMDAPYATQTRALMMLQLI